MIRFASVFARFKTRGVNSAGDRPRVRHPLLFRFAAIFIGLLPLVVVEAGLRLTGQGLPADQEDPFVGFHATVPLFTLNEAGDRYEIAKSRQVFFQPDGFSAVKSEREFRIFCLGGSTVQGRPYSIETAFSTWLELACQSADPSREWQVVNAGGVSYASYRLVPILREILADYEPDLIVLYTGHNEFLEARTYGSLRRQPEWLKNLHHRCLELHTYSGLRELVAPAIKNHAKPSLLPAEVDALLDYQGGLAQYHRDDEWHAQVISHFEHNLRRMIRLAKVGRVPIFLVNPVPNLKDTPPFKATNSNELTAEQTAAFHRAWEAAKAAPFAELHEKLRLANQAIAIDPRHAEPHFLAGRLLESLGRFPDAKSAYIRSKEEDVCPLRILEPMHEIVLQVAEQKGVELVDARARFDGKAENEISGDAQLIDHVHPRIEGHQEIAAMLFDAMVSHGMVVPRQGWEVYRDAAYRHRWRSLPENYFPESVARLKGLKLWSTGRVMRLRPTNDKGSP